MSGKHRLEGLERLESIPWNYSRHQRLPENDPKYMEILRWIDSQRFIELLDWVYNCDKPRASVERREKSVHSRRAKIPNNLETPQFRRKSENCKSF
jgi:hypothetical protein